MWCRRRSEDGVGHQGAAALPGRRSVSFSVTPGWSALGGAEWLTETLDWRDELGPWLKPFPGSPGPQGGLHRALKSIGPKLLPVGKRIFSLQLIAIPREAIQWPRDVGFLIDATAPIATTARISQMDRGEG